MEQEKVNDFLRELTALSKKYDIYINGCGCCGSPFLDDGKEFISEDLRYNHETCRYTVNE